MADIWYGPPEPRFEAAVDEALKIRRLTDPRSLFRYFAYGGLVLMSESERVHRPEQLKHELLVPRRNREHSTDAIAAGVSLVGIAVRLRQLVGDRHMVHDAPEDLPPRPEPFAAEPPFALTIERNSVTISLRMPISRETKARLGYDSVYDHITIAPIGTTDEGAEQGIEVSRSQVALYEDDDVWYPSFRPLPQELCDPVHALWRGCDYLDSLQNLKERQ